MYTSVEVRSLPYFDRKLQDAFKAEDFAKFESIYLSVRLKRFILLALGIPVHAQLVTMLSKPMFL